MGSAVPKTADIEDKKHRFSEIFSFPIIRYSNYLTTQKSMIPKYLFHVWTRSEFQFNRK